MPSQIVAPAGLFPTAEERELVAAGGGGRFRREQERERTGGPA